MDELTAGERLELAEYLRWRSRQDDPEWQAPRTRTAALHFRRRHVGSKVPTGETMEVILLAENVETDLLEVEKEQSAADSGDEATLKPDADGKGSLWSILRQAVDYFVAGLGSREEWDIENMPEITTNPGLD